MKPPRAEDSLEGITQNPDRVKHTSSIQPSKCSIPDCLSNTGGVSWALQGSGSSCLQLPVWLLLPPLANTSSRAAAACVGVGKRSSWRNNPAKGFPCKFISFWSRVAWLQSEITLEAGWSAECYKLWFSQEVWVVFAAVLSKTQSWRALKLKELKLQFRLLSGKMLRDSSANSTKHKASASQRGGISGPQCSSH